MGLVLLLLATKDNNNKKKRLMSLAIVISPSFWNESRHIAQI